MQFPYAVVAAFREHMRSTTMFLREQKPRRRLKNTPTPLSHEAGDLVLKTMAQIFRSHFRAEDVICRYGGEEFSIILPEASVEDAAKRANVLRDEVRKLTIRYLDQNLDPVTLSIGLATFPQHGSTAEQLLRIADQCLYQSKAAGRDRVTTPHASEDVTKREASVIG